jgi:hypothetical protein
VRRTHATPLIGLGVAGIVIGFLVETGIVAAGQPLLVPPVSLPITLIAIAAIIILLAIPIRRAVLHSSIRHIDPFRAARVAVLAKASSLAGALLTGTGVGVLAYLLSRSVLPGGGTIWLAVVATFGAAVLLAAGLVAERLCTLPPPSDEDDTAPQHQA